MATESDPGTPTAPEAAPAVEAPADAAPAAEPIGTEDGTEAVESSEASDLGIDGNLPEFELSGPLTNLAPAVQAEIHRMIGDRDKVVQDKLKDMQRGFTGKTTALAESRKALEAQIATLAEGSESWEALSSGDPSRMAELINTLPEVKAKILELAGTPTTQGAEDSNAKLLKMAQEKFGEAEGKDLVDLLEAAGVLKQDQPLRQEIDALKTAEAQRQADAEAARNLAAFQGWQTNWDKKWELPAGTSAGMTEAFSKAAASPADGARLLTLGLLVESGKVPVAMVPKATRAAIIKADQERIRKATDSSLPGLAGTGGSPPTVPGAFKPKPGSTPLQVTEQAEAWLKAHGRQ